MTEEYLTETEVSKWYGKALSTLRNDRYMNRGFPYVKMGRSVFYRKSDIEDYLLRCTIYTVDSANKCIRAGKTGK
jgi:predicted DNA-binding transcriptional regulator AlpA